MECERCNMKLSAYADGVLNSHEAAHLREHLETCRRCREDLAELRSLRSLLRALPDPEPSPMFWADTHRLLRLKAQSRRRSPFSLLRLHHGWGLATGLALMLLFIGMPSHLSRAPLPTPTIDPAALVSLHAVAHARVPLADPGTVRFALTESNMLDWNDDHSLDTE